MCILTVIEFKTGKILDYEAIPSDDEFAGLTPEEIQKWLKYRNYIEKLKKGANIDDLMNPDWSFLSLPDRLHDEEYSELSAWSKALTWELMSEEREKQMEGDFY